MTAILDVEINKFAHTLKQVLLRSTGYMAKAMWNGAVLAEADVYEEVEGNIYFPADSINKEYFKDSDTLTTCFWKGQASYYSIVVDGEENKDAAWYYPEPKSKAENIKDHIAFWKGIKVSE